MTGLVTVELLLRGAAIGGFVGLAVTIARGGLARVRIIGMLFCLAAAAHTLTQGPTIAPQSAGAWLPVWLFSVAGAGLFWLFATELFEDRARLEAYRLMLAAAPLLFGVAAAIAPAPVARLLWLAHNIAGAALMAHVLLVVATGWKSDLVESRRRLRGPVLAAGAAYALAITIVQSGEIVWRSAEALSPLAAALLFLLSVASMGAFLRDDPALFGPVPGVAEAPQPAPELDREDAVAAAALDRLMREERISREPGLTIAQLAARLGIPEYRLRRLINQRLGHRNFNAFLNQWRLAEAKEALADPAQREVPISTIALDAGFQSLGPFNRAFRADTGLTPSAYRTRAG